MVFHKECCRLVVNVADVSTLFHDMKFRNMHACLAGHNLS
jgi:hypothetical protein